MRRFNVTRIFRDKFTNQIYQPNDEFVSDEVERITDLQQRGLIGDELPSRAAGEGEKVSTRGNGGRRKAGTTTQPD